MFQYICSNSFAWGGSKAPSSPPPSSNLPPPPTGPRVRAWSQESIDPGIRAEALQRLGFHQVLVEAERRAGDGRSGEGWAGLFLVANERTPSYMMNGGQVPKVL